MEDIKFYTDKISTILEKIEIIDNDYLKHYYTHRLHVYLNKLYDQIELTIPYIEGEVTSDEEDENNVSD